MECQSTVKQAAELIVQIAMVEGAKTGGRVPRSQLSQSFCRLGWRPRDLDAGLDWARHNAWLIENGEEVCLTPKGQEADVFSHLAPRRS